MPKTGYKAFEALDPFFEIVMKGLRGLVDGKHYFDTFADDAVFDSCYHFPGWPVTIRGRANLMASLSGYGKTIKLQSGDGLVDRRLCLRGFPRGFLHDRAPPLDWGATIRVSREKASANLVGTSVPYG
jgi:hypothetical protein